jgi:hypothetical protein
MAQIILDSNNNLIQGDFDNATLNNRTKLQTTTTNATTNVYVVPNGSSTSAGVSVANNSSLTNASKIVMATNGSTDTQIISGVNGSGSYLPLNFYTNNALSMTIDTANNVGIGTSGPTTKLSLNGPMYVPATNFKGVLTVNSTDSQASGNGAGILLGGVFTGTTQTAFAQIAGIKENSTDANYAGALAMYYRPNGDTLREGMRIDSNGNVTAMGIYNTTTAGAVNVNVRNDGYLLRSTSALKYKTDIRDLPSIDINKFRPVVYKSKCEGDDKTKDHFGIIADEVHAAGIKELVSYNAEGEVEGFQYERFTTVLVKTVQEQQAIINELKTRIEALESK